MTYQSLGIGGADNDGSGDTLRIAADKINDNFLEIYTLIGDASSLSTGISATASVITLTTPTIATPNITGTAVMADLDISGDVDIDGTLEADAITINGITLSETISDTVGAMVSSNTETGITVSYEDGDNTLDFVLGSSQTTISSLTNTSLVIGRDADNDIDFATDNNIIFRASGTDQIKLIDGVLAPVTDAGVDLGTSTLEFKDAFFDGTVTSDAFAGPLTGNSSTATALETARTIHGVSFDGSANIDLSEVIQDTVGAMFGSNTETDIVVTYQDADGTIDLVVSDISGNSATATALETARTIGGVSFDGSANINLPGVNASGNQDTSGTAAIATTVTITDNESTNENNAIIFTAGGDVDGGNIGLESDGTLTYNPSTGKITATGFVGALTGDVTGNLAGNVTGNTSGTAATVTGAAQTNITSVGTLTALQVDNLNINGNTISSTAGTDLLITPLSGQQIVLDGTIIIDAGVVTGATSITSTAFVGDITGDVTGTADVATVATTVTITDNESTNENNAIIFTAGGDVDGGNIGLESDGTLTYNPSTGKITATGFIGALTGNVTGNLAGTVTTATQNSITTATGLVSVGALDSGSITSGFTSIDVGAGAITTTGLISGGSLDIDNVLINGTTIGHTDDTDLITLADGVVTIAGEISTTTLDIGGTNITATASELNILDASAGNTAIASDVASSAGAITSNNAKIAHTLTLAAELADDAVHADVTVTSDKCLATSTVIAAANKNVQVRIHTVVAGSFKVSITNLSGGALANDSTIILNYTII
jgi:hypothetical protein